MADPEYPFDDHPDDLLSDGLWAFEGICELLAVGFDKQGLNEVNPQHLLALLCLVKARLEAAQAGYDALNKSA